MSIIGIVNWGRVGQGILLTFWVLPALAQIETKPVQAMSQKTGEIEEYNVLKTDNSVRQGNYVRYRQAGFNGIAVLESGGYNKGMKEGEWRTFSEERPFNKLVSVGTYQAGLPEGQWFYYQKQYPASGPFTLGSTPLQRGEPTGAGDKSAFSVNVIDTTATLQAQGLYARGVKVGVWTYHNRNRQLIMKVDHFTNQLLYWQQPSGEILTGKAAAESHPLLYAGGKEKLQENVFAALAVVKLGQSGKEGAAEFIFAVDASGHQTGISLVGAAKPSKYEKLILAMLDSLPPTWIPRVTNDKAVAAEYHIRVTTTQRAPDGSNGVTLSLAMLGE